MILVLGTVRLPPDKLDDARPAMVRMMEASRAEAGCLEYVYAEDVADRGLIHVKERWRDRAALAAHFETEHIRQWRAAWPLLGIGERSLVAFDVGEPRPV